MLRIILLQSFMRSLTLDNIPFVKGTAQYPSQIITLLHYYIISIVQQQYALAKTNYNNVMIRIVGINDSHLTAIMWPVVIHMVYEGALILL